MPSNSGSRGSNGGVSGSSFNAGGTIPPEIVRKIGVENYLGISQANTTSWQFME